MIFIYIIFKKLTQLYKMMMFNKIINSLGHIKLINLNKILV
jgi:hypothetical protein